MTDSAQRSSSTPRVDSTKMSFPPADIIKSERYTRFQPS
jgi:hypothetical protein